MFRILWKAWELCLEDTGMMQLLLLKTRIKAIIEFLNHLMLKTSHMHNYIHVYNITK